MPEQLHEPTKYEILEAINKLSEHMDQQFAEVRQELAKKATTEELATVKATMVTKEYLDEKLAEHHDEPIKFVKGTDDKVKLVSQKLTEKKYLLDPTIRKSS
jgi:hypothetical protein